MPSQYRRPGVYIEESLLLNPSDVAGTTTVAAFVGHAAKGPVNIPFFIESWSDYVTIFGGFDPILAPDPVDPNDKTATNLVKATPAPPHPVNFINLASLKADTAIGDGQYTTPAFTAGQYVLLSDHTKAHYAGAAWAEGAFTGTGTALLAKGKDSQSYLPFSVYSFFQNGGRFAWVVRTVKEDSVTGRTASVVVGDSATSNGPGVPVFKINAISAGKWGNDLAYRLIVPDSETPEVFTLEIHQVNSAAGQIPQTYERIERFDNLSVLGTIPGSRRVDSAVNEIVGSRYVRISDLRTSATSPDGTPNTTVGALPSQTPDLMETPKALGGGNDPEPPGTADLRDGAIYLSGIEGPMNVNIAGYLADAQYLNNPGDAPANAGYVGNFFSPSAFTEREDVISINDDCKPRASGETGYAATMKTELAVDSPSSYTAAYGPWLLIPHPASVGSVIPIPPGGAVLGVIARIDATIGYHRAPAGVIATISNAVGVQAKFTDSELGELNYGNINVIRPVVGSGICVMGARTRKNYGPDHYLSARRTLINIKESLRRSTQYAVFENNDERLWSSLRITGEAILRPLWERGGLRGSAPSEAYYVRCDATLNPIQVISQGEVRMEVGVALQYPAEFVVIRITQITASTFQNEIQVV